MHALCLPYIYSYKILHKVIEASLMTRAFPAAAPCFALRDAWSGLSPFRSRSSRFPRSASVLSAVRFAQSSGLAATPLVAPVPNALLFKLIHNQYIENPDFLQRGRQRRQCIITSKWCPRQPHYKRIVSEILPPDSLPRASIT